jgi:hypothetical protein
VVVLYVGRHGGIPHAEGVSVGGIARWNVANGCLLGLPGITGVKLDVHGDRRIILEATRADLGIPLRGPIRYRAANDREAEDHRRNGQLHDAHVWIVGDVRGKVAENFL